MDIPENVLAKTEKNLTTELFVLQPNGTRNITIITKNS